LRRVKVEVDPLLEITEIVNRVGGEKKGPALLFENVKGSKFPVVVNTLATAQRIEWALGRSPDAVGKQIFDFAEDLMPPSPSALWNHRSAVRRVLSMKTAHGFRNAPVHQHRIEPADLNALPVAQSWPEDGGRFFTFRWSSPKVHWTERRTWACTVCICTTKREPACTGRSPRAAVITISRPRRQNKPLPVGGGGRGRSHPHVVRRTAFARKHISELAFAGFLRGERTRVSRLRDSGLSVPAESEFVLEGVVSAARAPHGRPRLWRSFRPLLAGRAVSGVQRQPDLGIDRAPYFQSRSWESPPPRRSGLGDAVQENDAAAAQTHAPRNRRLVGVSAGRIP
jgi:4-hydroxy-3-polyprenylbenzoate decarboxylase